MVIEIYNYRLPIIHLNIFYLSIHILLYYLLMPLNQLPTHHLTQSSLRNACNMKPSFSIMLIACLSLLLINAHSRNIPVHTPLPPDSSGECLPDEVKIDDPKSPSPDWFNPAKDVPAELYGKCVKCTEFTAYGEECQINTIRLQIITIK
jgi:hypothetical protein